VACGAVATMRRYLLGQTDQNLRVTLAMTRIQLPSPRMAQRSWRWWADLLTSRTTATSAAIQNHGT
jgi:hypothetical protein